MLGEDVVLDKNVNIWYTYLHKERNMTIGYINFGGLGYIHHVWQVEVWDGNTGCHTWYVDTETKEEAIKLATKDYSDVYDVKVYLFRK